MRTNLPNKRGIAQNRLAVYPKRITTSTDAKLDQISDTMSYNVSETILSFSITGKYMHRTPGIIGGNLRREFSQKTVVWYPSPGS
jgi:hypothetical protein